jgi:hypothetical protein
VSDEREGFWFTAVGLVGLFLIFLGFAVMRHVAADTPRRDATLARDCGALFARGDTVAALRWDRRCLDYLPEEAR